MGEVIIPCHHNGTNPFSEKKGSKKYPPPKPLLCNVVCWAIKTKSILKDKIGINYQLAQTGTKEYNTHTVGKN